MKKSITLEHGEVSLKLSPTHRYRLRKLAIHLESGELAHRKFNFSRINQGKKDEGGCGTSGCAIGELPAVFPRRWKFDFCDVFGVVEVCRPDDSFTRERTASFFGITQREDVLLFYPGHQAPWNHYVLGARATKEQVATGIRNFLKWNVGR